MAPSFDSPFSSLMCVEDSSAFHDTENNGFGVDDSRENHDQSVGFNGWFLFPLESDDCGCLGVLLEKECQFAPKGDYLRRLKNGDLDLGSRNEAVGWISMVNAHFDLGPLCLYLSISYFDRFFSVYELPKGKSWTIDYLAVACLSIAAKMDDIVVPLTPDLQVGEAQYVFDCRAVRRMELLVLSVLSWRMQAVTPFAFVDHFLYKLNDGKTPPKSSILLSFDIVLSTVKVIEFYEFMPSEVAAAVAISVARETKTVDIDKALSSLTQHIQKERVLQCIKLITELLSNDGPTKDVVALGHSVPQSPIGVLDAAACLSYKNDNTSVANSANNSHASPEIKRRKLDKL